MRDRLVEIHKSVEALRSVRSQLTSLTERLAAAGLEVDIEAAAKELGEALGAVEEELIQTRNEAGQDPLNFPPKLDNHYSHLYGQVNRTRGRPSAGAYRYFEDLNAIWAVQRNRLQALFDEDLTAINRTLTEAEVPAILQPRF